jgi:VanZ family protein
MTLPTRTTSSAGVRLAFAGVATAVAMTLTLAPHDIVAAARSVVMDILHKVANGVMAPMSYNELESAFNALLFVPLGAALSLLLSRRLWMLAPVTAFIVSLTVESVQVVVPGRVSDVHDVIWNTVGGALGAGVVGLSRLLYSLANRQSPSARTTTRNRLRTEPSLERARIRTVHGVRNADKT